jgi:hypothetical protein
VLRQVCNMQAASARVCVTLSLGGFQNGSSLERGLPNAIPGSTTSTAFGTADPSLVAAAISYRTTLSLVVVVVQ